MWTKRSVLCFVQNLVVNCQFLELSGFLKEYIVYMCCMHAAEMIMDFSWT